VAVFVVTNVNGPNYDPSRARREQDGWDEHAVFMDRLVDDGFVILGGPIGDGERVLLIVEAADEMEIRDRFTEDPWTPMGVLQIASIEPWTLWLDSRQNTAAE
jgi:uncharacterized protein YciI